MAQPDRPWMAATFRRRFGKPVFRGALAALVLLLGGCGGTDSGDAGSGGEERCGTVCGVNNYYVIGPGGGFYSVPICSSTCPPEPANRAPTASIAEPPTGVAGSEVTLDSTASDPDGDTLHYFWALLSSPQGSAAAIADDEVADLAFTPDVPGRYLFSLVVDDGELNAGIEYALLDVESPTLAGFELTSTQLIGPFNQNPGGIVAAAVDGGGDLDAIIGLCGGVSHGVAALLGDGAGGFTMQPIEAAQTYCNNALASGDFNADGATDVASYNIVLQGDGNGAFSPLTTLQFLAANVVSGDFNDDGVDDLAAVDASPVPDKALRILHGGAGGFVEAWSVDVTTDGVPLHVADFDGDGIDDLAYNLAFFDNAGNSSLTVVYGDAAGNYTASTTVAVPGLGALGAGDADGDGEVDILMSYKLGTQPNAPPSFNSNIGIGFAILLGQGGRAFADAALFDAANLAASTIHSWDFDEDGNLDFVFLGDSGAINLLTGDGAGGVSAVGIFDAANRFGGFAVGEYDGDAFPDLLFSSPNEFGYGGELRFARGADNRIP